MPMTTSKAAAMMIRYRIFFCFLFIRIRTSFPSCRYDDIDSKYLIIIIRKEHLQEDLAVVLNLLAVGEYLLHDSLIVRPFVEFDLHL